LVSIQTKTIHALMSWRRFNRIPAWLKLDLTIETLIVPR
jgi:hypothetical protein